MLDALASLRHRGKSGSSPWIFGIAGWENLGGYEQLLRNKVASLGLDEQVRFLGPQFGDNKDELLRAADAFVLASNGEGMPTVVLEAWSYGLPVLMTQHCNLPEGFAAGAAIPIADSPTLIADQIHTVMTMTESERRAMGERGRQLVARLFTRDRAAASMQTVYEWVVGGGALPDCVDIPSGARVRSVRYAS